MSRALPPLLAALVVVAILRAAGVPGDTLTYGLAGGLGCSLLILAADRRCRRSAPDDDEGG